MSEALTERLTEDKSREDDLRETNSEQAARINELVEVINKNASAAAPNTNMTPRIEDILIELTSSIKRAERKGDRI
jgi:hypothetical protein